MAETWLDIVYSKTIHYVVLFLKTLHAFIMSIYRSTHCLLSIKILSFPFWRFQKFHPNMTFSVSFSWDFLSWDFFWTLWHFLYIFAFKFDPHSSSLYIQTTSMYFFYICHSTNPHTFIIISFWLYCFFFYLVLWCSNFKSYASLLHMI